VCGIAGIWEFERRNGAHELRAIIGSMTAALAHRGPDGEGAWLDERTGLALGHRRLAIVGGSEGGYQPMRTQDGRYNFIVNGELYNYHELRQDLEREGYNFGGNCDAEVMLAGLAAWGLERALSQFNGMFAFALWDALERTLHLVRDRVGEKPLYYGWWDGCFLFGSEIKALRAHPRFRPDLDADALASYMRHSYVGGSQSIYRSIRKLPPGMHLVVKGRSRVDPKPYWSMTEMVLGAFRNPFAGDAAEAVEQLDRLITESVRMRLRSDVPVGVFLSGGLDSATILSIMARQDHNALQSFTIGMPDPQLDEAPMARAIADYLGSEHTESVLDEATVLSVIPRLAEVFDEPFADASAIPSLSVAALAGSSVKAVMGGDGGDEILGGYQRYAVATQLWNRTKWLPESMRRVAGSALQALGAERYRQVGKVLTVGYPRSIYWHLMTHWKDPGPLATPLAEFRDELREPFQASAEVEFGLDLLHLDLLTLLPGDLLVKVDRASMSEGVEVRLPFLDPAVMGFCLSLPVGLRNRDGQLKWVLRQVLRKYLPDLLIAGQKKGFAVPLAAWLRGCLREWAEELLSEKSLEKSEVFSARAVRECWQAHLSGKRDCSRALWNVLMFQTSHAGSRV
jgi:asparagine synthase (glutamine-hydrolysing)